MKWRAKKNREKKLNKLTAWHSHFAVFPVKTLDGSYVWMEKVWRKKVVTTAKGPYFIYSDAVTYPDDILVPDWSKVSEPPRPND